MKRVLKDGTIENKKIRIGNVVKKKDHWTNESVRIIKNIKCYVPEHISKIMKALDKKFSRLEFSIFGIINYNKNQKHFKVDSVYYIPKQKVSGASIDYVEDAPDGYNMVIHKHPRGCRSFSGTDDDYINQNFDYSLLWESGKFVSGQVRLKTPFGMVGISLDVCEEDEKLPIIPEDELNKIKEKASVVIYKGGYRNSYNSWDGCEDYNDYLFGGYGHSKNNKSIGNKLKKHHKNRSGSKSASKFPIEKNDSEEGSFLTKEQEEVHNFVSAQREELLEYLEEVETIKEERNVSWEEAENIYLKENKDSIHKSLLDFNSPMYGTMDIESENLKTPDVE